MVQVTQGRAETRHRGLPRWARSLLVPLLLLGTTAVARADDHVESFDNSVYPAEFRVRVNKAIQQGIASLRRTQRPDGSFPRRWNYPMGATALRTLTLLKCGVRADDPQVAKAFAYMRGLEMRKTYSVAVLLMALDAKYAPARDPFTKEDHDKYGGLRKKDPCAQIISKADKSWMKAGVKWLVDRQNAEGVWRYPEQGYDLSNTQFALLGLHAATRCGIEVKRAVWLDALDAVLGHQAQTGDPIEFRANEVRGRYRFEWTERALTRGFQYHPGTPVNGSMTTAGLTSLIICQNRLWRSRAFTGKLRVASRRGIRDAMAWLQRHFTVTHNPFGGNHWHLYYLYGLERCGILGRYRFLGAHDWYRAGADLILARRTVRDRNAAACFALLFLKRATSRMDAPVITPSGGAGAAPATMPETATPRWLRPSKGVPDDPLSVIAYWVKRLKSNDTQRAFRATIKLGELGNRVAVGALIAALHGHVDPYVRMGAAVALARLGSCNAVPALIVQLGDDDDLVRHAVNQALIRVTRYTKLRYLSALTADERIRLRRAWREWWKANEGQVRQRLGQARRKK